MVTRVFIECCNTLMVLRFNKNIVFQESAYDNEESQIHLQSGKYWEKKI